MRAEDSFFILHRMIADSWWNAKIAAPFPPLLRLFEPIGGSLKLYLRLLGAENVTAIAPMKLETTRKMTNPNSKEQTRKIANP